MSSSIGTTPAHTVANRNVVTVSPTTKLDEVAKLFQQHDINMAPVVDGFDKCVGVISGRDVVRYESMRERLNHEFQHGMAFDLAHYGEGPLDILGQPLDEVAYHMTTEIRTIDRDAPLSQAAKMMCREHLHHLVLMDSAGRPDGIISSLDILGEVIGEPVTMKPHDGSNH